MEYLLKQRLVGAAVLIALAVVLIPMLLDGSGASVVQRMPPEPKPASNGDPIIREQPVPQPDPPAPVTEPRPAGASGGGDETGDDEPAAATASADPAPPDEPPAADDTTPDAPRAWVVQVGSFREADKASAFRDTLREKGFAAFVEDFKTDAGKPMFRVRVGPELTEAAAKELNERLRKLDVIDNSFVTSHRR